MLITIITVQQVAQHCKITNDSVTVIVGLNDQAATEVIIIFYHACVSRSLNPASIENTVQ